MRPSVKLCLLALLNIAVSQPLFAQSISELGLKDALQAALARSPSSKQTEISPPYQASSWLAGLPTVNISYLDSDERFGTDETELSLNLPIKSGSRRKSDKVLEGLVDELDEVGNLQHRLYFSGLIRESVWSQRLAASNIKFAEKKLQLLLTLEQRYQDLLQANATSDYALLLIQKELITAHIAQQEYQQDAHLWLTQYKHLTGLGSVPLEIKEPALDTNVFTLASHPQMRQLELNWLQAQQLLVASSDKASPWNVSLLAKNLDMEGFEENQYGLAVEIPLSFMKMASQSNNSSWREASRQYGIAKDQLAGNLYQRWQMLAAEHTTLQEKQRLLSRSSQLSEKISQQIAALQADNEIAAEIALRRMMEAQNSRSAAARNQILIHQNNAMLRQATGLSL